MITLFKKFIKKEKLIESNGLILLAVSGGVDSMVMLDLFEKSDLEYGVAHMNFGLRGNDSDEDKLFVQRITKSYSRPFFEKKVKTDEYANQKGISIQMAARELRYQWFEELVQQENFQLLATAHHLNDSIETVLLNLGRGTGIAGMKGILPKKVKTIRPLLFATRWQIEAYARQNNIEWREDASNSSIKYDRNLVRHKVVPVMKQLNPSFEQVMGENLEKLKGVELLFEEYLRLLQNDLIKDSEEGIDISIKNLKKHADPKVLLYYLLKKKGFTFRQIGDVFDAMEGISGKIIKSKSHQLLVDREELKVVSISEVEADEIEINLTDGVIRSRDWRLKLGKLDRIEATDIVNDPQIAMLDFSKLSFPMKLRNWQDGDWFVPLGMKGKKKLSDFLIDQKVDLFQKKKVKVLCTHSGEIAWVLGMRISDKFKVIPKTKFILKVEILRE